MNTKIVKDIIEFTLQSVDWDSENLMPSITELLDENINVVIYDVDVLAIVQCNDYNNSQIAIDNGELVVNVLLVNVIDLATDII